MNPSHPHDFGVSIGCFGANPTEPKDRLAPPRLDASINRRIFRAYRHLQRARLDGNYRLIVKWSVRVDELLDGARSGRQLRAAEWAVRWPSRLAGLSR